AGTREDAVLSPTDDQHRNVDLRQVGAEIRLPGRDARDCGDRRRVSGDVPARLIRLVADQSATELVEVVEVVQEPLHPRRAILPGGLHETIEETRWQALRIITGLEQERRDRRNQDSLCYPL